MKQRYAYLTAVLQTAKIVNDPVHGFIRLPAGRVLKALEHPVVQRLRRLSQLGLAQFVYPGATHTRFLHALGVMHLADEALSTLHRKGVKLSTETWEAVLLAALLHDIGHGPFSHSLEGLLFPQSHEEIGQELLALLEPQLGDLSEVQALWKGTHPMPFLSQLLASQIDVDRLDYLVRDSFFTGVQEGLVGTERLIYTLQVAEGRLVIEEKGQTSVEKFIVTRRFMYWQVYLHKGVLGAEQLLRRWWAARQERTPVQLKQLEQFIQIDETTIWSWVKEDTEADFFPMRVLSRALQERVPYKVRYYTSVEAAQQARQEWERTLPRSLHPWAAWLWIEGWAESEAYKPSRGEDIYLLQKTGEIIPLLEASPWLVGLSGPTRRFFAGGLPVAWLGSQRP